MGDTLSGGEMRGNNGTTRTVGFLDFREGWRLGVQGLRMWKREISSVERL